MHEPVEDAVGDCRISDLCVPGGNRQLACEQCGAHLVTLVSDLEKVATLSEILMHKPTYVQREYVAENLWEHGYFFALALMAAK